jgi:hypothetical protein
MKKIFLTFAVVIFTAVTLFAQKGNYILKQSALENSNGNFQTFVKEKSIVVYDIIDDTKGASPAHMFYFLDIGSNQSVKLQLRSIDKTSPVLFGPSYSSKGFGIYESTYDLKSKTRSIHYHILTKDGSQETMTINSYKDDVKETPKFFYVSDVNKKFNCIYILRPSDGNTSSSAFAILLDDNFGVINTSDIKFDEKISTEFNDAIHLTSNGILLMTHKTMDSKDITSPFIYSIDIKQNKSILRKEILMKSNSFDVSSYRSFIDEKGLLQFYGLFTFNQNPEKVAFLKLIFDPNKGTVMNEKRIQHDFSMNHQLNGILTINERMTIFSALSYDSDLSKTNNKGRLNYDDELRRQKDEQLRQQNDKGANNSSKPANVRNEVKTITFVCTDHTGTVIWHNSFKAKISDTYLEKMNLHEAAKGYSYWSDSEFLYCIYNATSPGQVSLTAVENTPNTDTKISPYIRTYNLKTGEFTDKQLEISENIPGMTLLSGLLHFSSSQFAVSYVGIQNKRFMPIIFRF